MKFIIFLALIWNLSFGEKILLFSTLDENLLKTLDLEDYLMSEKLDGVRGIWDTKELKTRKNYKIKSPEFFTKNFPPFKLDGELWTKRGDFDAISALVRSDDEQNELWQKLSYNVFDVPNACEEFKLNPCTLKKRLEVLEEYLKIFPNPRLKVIKHYEVKNANELKEFYTELLKQGAEGIIVRKNHNIYENSRSKLAFKFKPFLDAECKVVGYTQGKGKFQGKVGALICSDEKNTFKVASGLKDKDRENPPKIGTIITYKYNGFTKNSLPRFPVFLRIRE